MELPARLSRADRVRSPGGSSARLLAVLVAAALLGLTACSGDDNEGARGRATTTTVRPTTTTTPGGSTVPSTTVAGGAVTTGAPGTTAPGGGAATTVTITIPPTVEPTTTIALPPGQVARTVAAGAVCQGTGQVCTPRSGHQVTTSRVLGFRFKANADSCSTIKLVVFLDGTRQGESPPVAPDQTVGYDFEQVPAGTYLLELQAEGLPGGCNTGTLVSWAGALTITTSV